MKNVNIIIWMFEVVDKCCVRYGQWRENV